MLGSENRQLLAPSFRIFKKIFYTVLHPRPFHSFIALHKISGGSRGIASVKAVLAGHQNAKPLGRDSALAPR